MMKKRLWADFASDNNRLLLNTKALAYDNESNRTTFKSKESKLIFTIFFLLQKLERTMVDVLLKQNISTSKKYLIIVFVSFFVNSLLTAQCETFPDAVNVYKVHNSLPACGLSGNSIAGVFFASSCDGGGYQPWQANDDLFFVQYATSAQMIGTVSRDGVEGNVDIIFNGYSESGYSHWTNSCYLSNLSNLINYDNFSGGITLENGDFISIESTDSNVIVIGNGAGNSGTTEYGFGGWPDGGIGNCSEMFGNLEIFIPEEAPYAITSFENPDCGIENGIISFAFNDTDNRTHIEFSIDGGNNYDLFVEDNIGSASFTDLSAGTYDVFVRWGNDDCPVGLGNISLSDGLQAAGSVCNDGNPNTINDIIQADGCTCEGSPSGPNIDCNDISITTEEGNIIVSGLDGAPVTSVQVFDITWQGVYNCFANCNTPTEIIPVSEGQYYVYVKYYSSYYSFICEEQLTITVEGGNTCNNVTNGGTINGNQTVCAGEAATTLSGSAPTGGTGTIEYLWLSSTSSCPTSLNQQIVGANGASYNPGVLSQTTYFVRCSRRAGCTTWTQGESNCVTVTVDNTPNCNDNSSGEADCENISITTTDSSISVSGLNAAAVTSVQIFTDTWQGVFSCFADCNSPTETVDVPEGSYLVYVKYYNSSYQLICEVNESVTVESSGTGGNTCAADAGNLNSNAASVQLTNGSATIGANSGGGLNMPTGFQKVFVLTEGTDLIIRELSQNPSFIVSSVGNYTIHTLVYNPNTLDLNTVQIGITTGYDINNLLQQGGGIVCGSLDVTGASVTVTNENTGGGTGSEIDLELSISGDGSDIGPYTNFSVTLTLNNTGSSTANNVNVSIPQPANVVFQGGNAFTASQGIYDPFSSFTWSVGTVAAGSSVSLTLNYFSLAGAPYTVYAQVIGAEGTDVDSTPNNGNGESPLEDDEAVYTTGTGGGGGTNCTLNLTANISNIHCNDNGTPGNPNDDTFNFTVTAEGGNPWGWTGGGQSGSFGIPQTFGAYPVSGGTVAFTLTDNDNPTCTVNVSVNPPATCSEGGGGEQPACNNISITTTEDKIMIGGLDGAPVTSVQIFTADWSETILNCFGNCATPTVMENVAAGDYIVYVKYYTEGYELICQVNETVSITGGSGPIGDISLTCGSNINVNAAPGANSAVITYPTPEASSTCPLGELNLQRVAGPASGAVFQVGTTSVTYQATDNCNNTETCSFTVTIDNESANLSINCSNDITVNSEAGETSASVFYVTPIVTSTCPGQVSLSRIEGPASGSVFPSGTTTVTYQAMDNCGNTEICSFEVTVSVLSSNISISCPANVTVPTAPGAANVEISYDNPEASTDCILDGLSIVLTEGPASGTICPPGTVSIKYTASDSCGGMEMCTFAVTVTATPSCQATREVSNSIEECSSGNTFGIRLGGNYYTISSGTFVEYSNGTAKLTGHVTGLGEIDLIFSGRTIYSYPVISVCFSSNTSNWYYYSNFSGTIGSLDIVSNSTHITQIGIGANKNQPNGVSASAWFYTYPDLQSGEINFRLSGSPGIPYFSEGCEEVYSSEDFDNNIYDDTVVEEEIFKQKSLEYSKIDVYPNPAKNNVNINLNSLIGTYAIINVYDMLGRNIEQTKIDIKDDFVYQINTSEYNPGTYSINIKANNMVTVTKQIVVLKD